MSKIFDGIMGVVTGDALGVPVEFKERDSYELTDMIGFGTYNQKPGTWSDDSSMTLATLESIGRLGIIDPSDIMNNFYEWLQNSKFTPWGKVFDVGGATRRAIVRYAHGIDPLKCGGKTRMDNGNGALMRILPVAMFAEDDPHDKMVTVKRIAGLTHDHPISHIACFIYAFMVEDLLNGIDKRSALSNTIQIVGGVFGETEMWQEFRFLPKIDKFERDEIKSSGYVVDTLEAAIWCFLNSCSYRECVLLALTLPMPKGRGFLLPAEVIG